MNPDNESAASPAAPAAETKPSAGPSGVSGWLILIAFGLIVTPIRLGMFIFSAYVPLFNSGAWSILTSPGSERYHWAWKPLLLLEIFGNVAFVVWPIVLLFLLFTHSRRFPRQMIAYLIANLLFIGLDLLAVASLPNTGDAAAGLIPDLVRSIVVCAIWVPYFLASVRVRNTFTK
jgi:Protein of unknown function (DUF2569)